MLPIVFHSACTILYSHQHCTVFPFFHITNTCYFCHSHSNRCSSFALYFPDSDVEHLFIYLLAIWIFSLEKCLFRSFVAAHSSTLAWKIPWTEEPGGLQSMGSLRVGHNWETSLSLFTFMHWRRKWQPTPVFLPGESQGQGSLVGCHLWGRTELDTTEAT